MNVKTFNCLYMNECVHIRMCVRMRVCLYVHACMYMRRVRAHRKKIDLMYTFHCLYMNVCVHIRMCVRMRVCLYVHACMYMRRVRAHRKKIDLMYTFHCLCVHVRVHVCACVSLLCICARACVCMRNVRFKCRCFERISCSQPGLLQQPRQKIQPHPHISSLLSKPAEGDPHKRKFYLRANRRFFKPPEVPWW